MQPRPGYPIYESFIRCVGAKPVPIHLKEEMGFTLSGADIAAAISPRTKMIFLNFPSNSRQIPRGVRIYSDEVYENILFDGARHQNIISFPGMEERTVLVSGASKTFSWTGGRIGWALFPTTEEAEVFKNLNINYFSCIPAYNQEGARLGLESPLAKEAIHGMVEAFQERRDLIVRGLSSIPGMRCQKPKGAFYDPQVCARCGSPMPVLAVITDLEHVSKILLHLVKIGCPHPGIDPSAQIL